MGAKDDNITFIEIGDRFRSTTTGTTYTVIEVCDDNVVFDHEYGKITVRKSYLGLFEKVD